MRRQVLLTVALVATLAGRVSPVRDPVRGYAGINTSWQQAVLVEPTPTTPSPSVSAAASDRINNRNVPVFVSNPSSNSQDELSDKPTAAALLQTPHLGRPTPHLRPLNGSRLMRQRLRQQMQGRRPGFWRKAAGGLNVGNRRLRPGMAGLSGGPLLPKRRRRPVGSLMSLDQWRNASVVLNNGATLQNGAVLWSSTSQSKESDFLSGWHSSYSRSQTKAQDNIDEQEPTTEEATVGESQNTGSQTSASLPKSGHSSFRATATTTSKKPSQNLAPKLPYVSPRTASIPSVHDMTSMHFKKVNDSSPGVGDVPEEALKKSKGRKSSGKMTARTSATNWLTTDHTKTTPLPTKRSITRASPDGKEILDSIQSIFQAAKTDERELSSMKSVHHGNTSPQPLDVFSGILPIYGFMPSDHVQPQLSLQENTHVSQAHTPPEARQDSLYPTSWTTTRRPYHPVVVSQASDVISNALATQRSPGGDLLLQVGHSIPVQEQQRGPEHREAGGGDIILDSEAADDIIFGRPAALIQAPDGQTRVMITAAPESYRHSRDPLHFLTTEEPAAQRDLEDPSILAWQSQELGPLLDFVSTKYKPSQVESVPQSVMSLQSMINTGRIPEVFRRDQVMDYIREDRLRYRQPAVDRMGEPWTNSLERIRMHQQVNEGLSGGGQFVALSSLALLLAFCGYFLYSASGTSRESRGAFPPLKEAVDEAKNGLYILLQGLDEYEDHLDEEEEESDDEDHIEDNDTTQEDIPTILHRIWNTIVPPEVQVMSGLVRYGEEGHKAVNREPHAMEMPTSKKEANDFNSSQVKQNVSHYESVIRPTLGLTSVANSFLNSLINNKAIKSIISQLKSPSPPPSIEKQDQSIGSHEEMEKSSSHELKNNSKSLPNEPEGQDRSSTNQKHSQESEEATAVLSDPELESQVADDDSSQQEGLTTFTGTGTRQGAVREVTEKLPSARKRVILNNRLHVHHNPETDPPRTAAFVDNVPLKPLT
ncbi:uncharacterized protein [Panulirus ornatus]|uniref:uncharacterized protein n=1 Tax=Panulirus ornatus TaxID=150431 RepID=UPI003A8ACA58